MCNTAPICGTNPEPGERRPRPARALRHRLTGAPVELAALPTTDDRLVAELGVGPPQNRRQRELKVHRESLHGGSLSASPDYAWRGWADLPTVQRDGPDSLPRTPTGLRVESFPYGIPDQGTGDHDQNQRGPRCDGDPRCVD